MDAIHPHRDSRYQTLEVVKDWEIRAFDADHPDYALCFNADCMPIQLLHRPTGTSLLTASTRTCQSFELMLPENVRPLPGRPVVSRDGRRLCVLRCRCYWSLYQILAADFGVTAPRPVDFMSYALMDRPGPKELAVS